MTIETEKLEDALKVEAAFGKDFPSWAEMDDAFSEKYGEKYCVVIEQAARRYAEVLPLLGEMAKQKTPEELGEDFEGDYIEGYESMVLTARKIAAIVARGE